MTGSVIASAIAGVLAHGRPTPFAFEGACRFGIRSGLCLDGWRWPDADVTAADVVADALRKIGARRPTWAQGQPEWTEPVATRCLHCRRVIIEEGRRKYCSTLCRRAHEQRLYLENHRAEARAASQAWRDARRALATEKPCDQCGRAFKPLTVAGKRKPRFCTKSCAASYGNSLRRGMQKSTASVLRSGAVGLHATIGN